MIRFIELLNETNFNPKMERTSTPRFSVGETHIVVGSPETVASRLNRNTSQLLKG